MFDQQDIDKVAVACRVLDWCNIPTEMTYSCYWCLPQIILDAVFSINARYKAATNVVERYAKAAGLQPGWEQTISGFLTFAKRYDLNDFASAILGNSQRTSPRGGILKAEAAIRFAQTLQQFEVDCLAHKDAILDSDQFCRHIRAIPGQQVSCDYFLMMLGRKDLVKPDRRVLAFLHNCLDGRELTGDQAYVLLNAVTRLLALEHCGLQPRFLDHLIWRYMDAQPT